MTVYEFAAATDGAVSLCLQRGGGLYWVTAAVVTGFVSATANAWVLLVEIRL
jgi:modulator of FtsH protease